MTEDFKKGLATGLAIGGVTVVKGGSGNGIVVGDYIEDKIDVTYNGFLMIPPQLLVGDYNLAPYELYTVDNTPNTIPTIKVGDYRG